MFRMVKYVGAALALTFCVSNGAAADAMKLGVVTPAKQAWTLESVKFAEAVGAATEGRHTVEVFHSGQLGNQSEMFRQLQTGTLDFALIAVSELANRVQEFNKLLAPGLVQSNEHAAKFLMEAKTPTDLLALLETRAGVKGLAYGMAGVTQVMANFDAASPADMKGKRVRITPSPAILDFNKIIGSAPIPIPLPGVYDAFANGQVDALETNLDIMRVLKIADHAKTLLISNQGLFPAVVLVSLRRWKTLSPEDQEVIAGLAADFGKGTITSTLEAEEKSMAYFEGLDGLKIVHVKPDDYVELQKEWDAVWSEKVDGIAEMRAEAAALAE